MRDRASSGSAGARSAIGSTWDKAGSALRQKARRAKEREAGAASSGSSRARSRLGAALPSSQGGDIVSLLSMDECTASDVHSAFNSEGPASVDSARLRAGFALPRYTGDIVFDTPKSASRKGGPCAVPRSRRGVPAIGPRHPPAAGVALQAASLGAAPELCDGLFPRYEYHHENGRCDRRTEMISAAPFRAFRPATATGKVNLKRKNCTHIHPVPNTILDSNMYNISLIACNTPCPKHSTR